MVLLHLIADLCLVELIDHYGPFTVNTPLCRRKDGFTI